MCAVDIMQRFLMDVFFVSTCTMAQYVTGIVAKTAMPSIHLRIVAKTAMPSFPSVYDCTVFTCSGKLL